VGVTGWRSEKERAWQYNSAKVGFSLRMDKPGISSDVFLSGQKILKWKVYKESGKTDQQIYD